MRIGLGTHLVRDVEQAAANAVACGVTWIDTAPNYAHGQAQRLLAPMLKAAPEVAVSSKVGFFDKATALAAIDDKALSAGQASSGHCISPRYIRWQIERTLTELQRDRLDLLFLHNPERASASERWTAFAELEEQADAGRIAGYGISTWDGFAAGSFTVAELAETARTAAWGGPHRFSAIQLPVSLVNIEPIVQALSGQGPIVHARGTGMEVFASSPLHGGELPALVTPELAALVGDGLDAVTAALAVVASTPGVSRVLVSTSTRQHWVQAAGIIEASPVPASTLRKVIDVLTG